MVDTDISAKKIADQNHCNWYESVDEMLTEERINGAVLSTPTTLHAKQAQLFVQKDIPVLIEKPITASTAEGKELPIPRVHGMCPSSSDTIVGTIYYSGSKKAY